MTTFPDAPLLDRAAWGVRSTPLAPPASLRTAGPQVHESLLAFAVRIGAELEHRSSAEG